MNNTTCHGTSHDGVARPLHWSVVALIVVQFLMWENVSSRGWTVKFFGVLKLPALMQAGSAVGHAMGDVHSVVAWVLCGLIVMHVTAAVFHRLILKDDTLQRMLP